MPFTFERVDFRYGRTARVFQGLSLEIPQGRTLLLGPNGAGKSTLLLLASSGLSPQRGTVRLRGLDATVRRDRAEYRRQVGWLPQFVQVVPALSVREQAAYGGWLKGMSRSEAWDASLIALAKVGLDDISEQRADRLSGGQLRRVGLAQVLVHRPSVLVLDEPTASLDPAQRRSFRGLIESLAADVDIVVSTHHTSDIETAYEHVVVLAGGEVVWRGRVNEFLELGRSEESDAHTGETVAETSYARILEGNLQ